MASSLLRSRHWAAVFCVLLFVTACDGDNADTSDDAAPSTESSASGTATIDGVTYEFTDVTLCEVGSDTWGPKWRDFIAFDDTGHNYMRIQHAAPPDDWMTSFDLKAGLHNARTLDEGNPDIEWTTGLGAGTVTATLTDTGAEGTAEATDLTVNGAVRASASWSFSC